MIGERKKGGFSASRCRSSAASTCLIFLSLIISPQMFWARLYFERRSSSSPPAIPAMFPEMSSRLETAPLPPGLVDKTLPRKVQASVLPHVESANVALVDNAWPRKVQASLPPHVESAILERQHQRSKEKRTQFIRRVKESKEYQDAKAFMGSAASGSDKENRPTTPTVTCGKRQWETESFLWKHALKKCVEQKSNV